MGTLGNFGSSALANQDAPMGGMQKLHFSRSQSLYRVHAGSYARFHYVSIENSL